MSTNAATGEVYTGTWINWTDGQIRGATLTVTFSNGAYLIAFLALFVRVAGGHFWGLLCYALFRFRSTTHPRDGLHHQHQAILRNTNSDASALFELLSVGWAWRQRAKKPVARSGAYALLASLNIAAFAVAGIFSSRVTTASSDVLLKPGLCGGFTVHNSTPIPTEQYVEEWDDQRAYIKESLVKSASFAMNCYGLSSQDRCAPLGREWINFTTTTDIQCPFEPSMCVNGTAMRMDTGYMDSHLQFGINTKKEDRSSYRIVMDCAPITTEGFQSGWLAISDPQMAFLRKLGPSLDPNARFILFYYGQDLIMAQALGNETGPPNLTFAFSNASLSYTQQNFLGGNPEISSYSLDSLAYYPGLQNVDDSNLSPIPQLTRTDADVTIQFLASSTKFTKPVYDPWFSAQKPFQDPGRLDVTYYIAEWPVKVVACAEQWQICNVRTGNCTSLSDIVTVGQQLQSSALGMDYYGRQGMVGSRFMFMTLAEVIPELGSGTLLAQQYNTWGWSTPVPDNQWILEFQNWFAIRLTQIQRNVFDYVVGPDNTRYQKYITPPPANETWMCSNQIVQRSGYTSFSILGMAIILILGGLIIITNLAIDSVLGLVGNWHAARNSEISEWKITSLLQLQRIAFEGRQKGTWSQLTSLVPVTEMGEKFSLYDDDPQEKPQDVEASNSSDSPRDQCDASVEDPQSAGGSQEEMAMPMDIQGAVENGDRLHRVDSISDGRPNPNELGRNEDEIRERISSEAGSFFGSTPEPQNRM